MSGNKKYNHKNKPKTKAKKGITNIYDGCKKTKNTMSNICAELDIPPAELFQELYYQLPYSWIKKFRDQFYRKVARQLENGNLSDYISDSYEGDSYNSSISGIDSISEYSDV